MYFESTNSCCGIAEIHDMGGDSLNDCKELLKEVFRDGDWGMAVAWFAKIKGNKNYGGHDTLRHFKTLGFQELTPVNNPHHPGNKLLMVYLRKEDYLKSKWSKEKISSGNEEEIEICKKRQKEIKEELAGIKKKNPKLMKVMYKYPTPEFTPQQYEIIDRYEELEAELDDLDCEIMDLEDSASEKKFGPDRANW